MSTSWTMAQMDSQAGRRFLITGANSGVGYSAAVELARRGGIVMLACRDRTRGEAALSRLRQEASGPESAAAQAELIELDLASLDSIRSVAEAMLARQEPLHCLINNAGVMAPPKRLTTKDGFELQFGTNVLGHFALTCRLLPALLLAREAVLADAPRVVTLASVAHKRGTLNLLDLQSEQSYSPMGAYQQSKLADLIFAMELDRRLRARQLALVSVAVHPGVAKTSLFKVGSGKGIAGIAEKVLQGSLGILFNSELGGAIPTLYAATAPGATGGAYYGSQGFQELRGGDVGPAHVAPRANDLEAAGKLWAACERLTGVGLVGGSYVG